jgi:hypothetical protein
MDTFIIDNFLLLRRAAFDLMRLTVTNPTLVSNQQTYWAGDEKKRAIEEQIDPSFSRESLHPINQLAQQDAAAQLAHAQQQAQGLTEESFDVAAAAVAVSNDNNQQGAPGSVQSTGSNVDGDSAKDDGEGTPLSRNGRPLSGTKRAAQNRMAQRAFRQRKEIYIKELEDKAKEVDGLKQTIDALKQENMQLRDYSLALQAKLIEQPDVPTPPVVFNTRTKKE